MYTAVFNSLSPIFAQELFQLSEELKIAGNKVRCRRSKISHPNVSSIFGVTAAVWGWALSWSNRIVRESIPRRRFCVPRISFLSVAQYVCIDHSTFWHDIYTVAKAFRANRACLIFWGFFNDEGWCQSSDWCFDPAVIWDNQISSPVTIWSRKASPSTWWRVSAPPIFCALCCSKEVRKNPLHTQILLYPRCSDTISKTKNLNVR